MNVLENAEHGAQRWRTTAGHTLAVKAPSAHALTAEVLITQSHQDIPLCSLMTVAIIPKDCNMLIRRPRISKTFWARRNPSTVSRWTTSTYSSTKMKGGYTGRSIFQRRNPI